MGDSTTIGLAQAGVYVRRNGSANLKHCTPQEVQWMPQPR